MNIKIEDTNLGYVITDDSLHGCFLKEEYGCLVTCFGWHILNRYNQIIGNSLIYKDTLQKNTKFINYDLNICMYYILSSRVNNNPVFLISEKDIEIILQLIYHNHDIDFKIGNTGNTFVIDNKIASFNKICSLEDKPELVKIIYISDNKYTHFKI